MGPNIAKGGQMWLPGHSSTHCFLPSVASSTRWHNRYQFLPSSLPETGVLCPPFFARFPATLFLHATILITSLCTAGERRVSKGNKGTRRFDREGACSKRTLASGSQRQRFPAKAWSCSLPPVCGCEDLPGKLHAHVSQHSTSRPFSAAFGRQLLVAAVLLALD